MNEYENSTENISQERGKWFTYGGKVDENLMNMLKEAQKTAGIRKFSDFMNDMLKIYRENKQDVEPPQMQVIKKAVTDILTTTESLLNAMQIIEADKYKAIDDYQERAQEREEHALQATNRIKELEAELSSVKKDLVTAQAETRSIQTELKVEIERRKSIEGLINRIQHLADDAVSKKEKAEVELNTILKTATEDKNKITMLDTANQDLKSKIESASATIDRLQEELRSERNTNKVISETLQRETIARNRLEERLHIFETQFHASNERMESLQKEVNRLYLNEQTMAQKASLLESELQTARVKLQEFQQLGKRL